MHFSSLGALAAAAILASASFAPGQTNTLLIVADDVGVDAISAYKEGASPPPTPNLDALANSGVLFRNAYANPICSPTRATLFTGRYSRRTGVGDVISHGKGTPLPLREFTLAEVLNHGEFATGLFGKWHLGDSRNGGDLGPNKAGWSHFAGHIWNINSTETYYSWRKVVNGKASTRKVYATTDNINDAISWISTQESSKKPWTCCICFNTAHAPFHAPPANLHTRNLVGKTPFPHVAIHFKAMVEAMDTEIGRLIKTVGSKVMAKTNVIFVGDNGTPDAATQLPFLYYHAKTTLYEGGINVPLIISGPAVKNGGREEKSLVSSVDLFSTVLELSGIDPRKVVPRSIPIDGISLLPYLDQTATGPLRTTVYAERFDTRDPTKDGVAIRNATYKLIEFGGHTEFYNLVKDPFEKDNLLKLGWLPQAQRAHFDALRRELRRLVADSFPFGRGCAGNAGVPQLELVNDQLPRLNSRFPLRVTSLPSNVVGAIGVLGFSDTSASGLPLPLDLQFVGMPGCELAVSLDFLSVFPAQNGAGDWVTLIPNISSLLGKELYQQVFVPDADVNKRDMISSHAIRLTVGAK